MDDADFYLEDLKSKFKKINPKEYYLSYSGGKDSHFLYWFIKNILKDEDIQIISVNTLFEHIEILDRMKKYSDKVLIPVIRHKELKEKYGIPCFSKHQDEYIMRYQRGCRTEHTMDIIYGRKTALYGFSKKPRELLLSDKLHKISSKCCYYLKKKPLMDYEKVSGRKAIVGLRKGEGILRRQFKSCFTKEKKFMPILDLSDELMDKICMKYNIEIPYVYRHIRRTGCFGCPYGKNIIKELSLLNDAQRRFVKEYFKESYDVIDKNIMIQPHL